MHVTLVFLYFPPELEDELVQPFDRGGECCDTRLLETSTYVLYHNALDGQRQDQTNDLS